MRHTLISAAAALGLLAASPALAAPKGITVVSQDTTPPPVSQQLPSDSSPGVQALRVHSERIGRDFVVVVHLPGPTPFLPGQKLPAIYALDGGLGLAGQTGLLLGLTGVMAPAYVVEIGYPPGQAGTIRNEDLTHAKAPERPASGGGAAFEAFLLEDLRPFLEARFPLDPHRSILFGHSLGGLFTARMFADKPDAFSGYIIGSASVWVDPAVVAAVAEAAPKARGARVYLAVSALEDNDGPPKPPNMMDGFKQLSGALRNRSGVALKAQVYAGQNHASYYPRLALDAFPFVLPPSRPLDFRDQPLSDEALKRYAGVYGLPDGRTLTVKPLKGESGPTTRLRAQMSGHLPFPLMESGKDRFYAKSADLDVTFDGAGLTMVSGDTKARFEKLKAEP
jgi:predicted alpha/beta superfamily hydrolase